MNVLQMDEPKLMRKQTGSDLFTILEMSFIWLKINVFNQKLYHIEFFFFLPETEYSTKSSLNYWFSKLAAHWNCLGNLAPTWFRWSGVWPRHWEWFSCAAEIENHRLKQCRHLLFHLTIRLVVILLPWLRNSVMSSGTSTFSLVIFSILSVSVSTLRHKWPF